jgi:hypothetical protein
MRKYIMPFIIMCTLCACSPIYKGNTSGTKVGVVGDSITNYATPQVEATLAPTYHYAVGSTPGINLKDARGTWVRPMVGTHPEVLVVELGINSARDGWDSTDLPHLEGVLKDVRTVPCVVWVVPDALDTSYYDNQGTSAPTLHERILQFKASLEKRLPANPNVHLAYWGAQERTHPAWYGDDGLHNSNRGETAYATYVKNAITTYCG